MTRPGSSSRQPIPASCAAVALVRVWFPVVIVVLACIGPAIGAAQQLPPAAGVQPLPYERLDSTLNRVVTIFETSGRSADAARRGAQEAPLHEDGSVAVIFHVDSASNVRALESYLRTNGGDPRNVGEDYIEAYVPVALLVPASEQPGVIRVESIVPPQPSLGPTTSQGVAVHGANNWHDHGYTGVGVKVGVIDVGFGGIVRPQSGGELPGTIMARCYRSVGLYDDRLSTCEASDEVHGTPVAESLMDIAPDAQLYIANPFSWADLAASVQWMIDQGVDVINHSVTWTWDGPGDGTSPELVSPLNTVSLAVENGIVWVNSAGNSNEKAWYGQFNSPDGDDWHDFERGDELNDFGGGDATQFQLRSQYPARLCLFEVDVSPAREVECGGFTSSSFPSVSIRWSTESGRSYGLAVQRESGSPSGWIQLLKWGSQNLEYGTARSIGSPAESPSSGMLAVGAAHWSTPSEIEPFSSRGPLPIDRGVVKPDIVGADGARTSIWPAFHGTSQAAPHVAGLVALVRQRYADWSPAQYVDYLEGAAEARGGGNNNTWGWGFAKLPSPSGSLSPPDLVVSAASVDDDTLDAGQTTFLNYTIRNDGNGAAAGSPRVTSFRSADATISWDDTAISTDTLVSVDSLGPGETVSRSTWMPAAPSAGTWYYGACVQSAAGESNTANNCSAGVPVIVSGGPGGCALDDLGTLSGTVTVTGALDNDCVSPNWSGELARYYSFTLGTAASVEIDLVSSEFDAWLTLREGADVTGRSLIHDDDGGQGSNARIDTALSAGTYTIEATSYAPGETGAFTLTVTAAGGGGGGGCALDDLGALSGTVTRVGNLGNDCESPSYSGRLARYYSFTLGQAGSVEIDLFSTAFDAFLTLREGTDIEGRLVATDDDGGQGTNSRIATELSAGTYTIEATSYATGVTGAFTLRVTGSGGGGGGGCALDDLGALSGTATRVGNLGNDCESPNYSGKLARYYSFTLGQAGSVEIDLVSSVFDAFLALREGTDVAGRLVVSDDDGGLGTNSRISTELSAGTYTIEATSYATGVTGAFTLTVTGSGGGGGGCALDDLGALSGTVTRVGSLGDDCESPSYSGRLARYYSFTLGQAGPVEVDLVSSAFDTFLALREGTDVAGRLVVSDDDGGQGTNSRISTALSAGTYTIEATSYGTGVTGAFTLTVTGSGGGGGGGCALDDLGALSGTATRVGNLGDDCESPSYSGRLARYYSFTLGQAGSVEIDLVSSVFDTWLALRVGADVAGRLVVSDDDGGQGTNSRISTALSAGTYTIEATSYGTGVTGAFTLTATAAGGGGGGGCALDDLGVLSGTVTRVGNLGDDCASPNYSGRLARYYSFTLGQAGSVEIDLVSSAFDTWLTLREGADVAGGLVVSDDDGGQGTNSRIGTALSAGTYTIEATSYASGVTGAFTLTVTVTQPTGELTITSNGGGDRATITLPENQRQVTTVTASGGTPPYEFQWSSNAAAPDGLKFVMNTTTGALAFATAPDYENPADSDGDNDYGVNVRVTDASVPRQRDSQVITVRITDVAGRDSDEDRAVLEALYDATGGAGWTDSTNWKTSAPLDDWYGVTTDADGRVSQLDLSWNGLTGPTPVELGGLVNLQRLELFSNDLTGPIPAELGSLVNLETLDLSGNHLTGSIPAELRSLANLEWLSLGSNELTGSIPAWLGELLHLRSLGLDGNALTGSIPAELRSLTNLETLDLGGNDLTGSIPAELRSLANLEWLSLGSNELTGPIPAWLGELVQLRSLGLDGNALTGSIPAELGSLANLEWLSLGSNELTDPIPGWLGQLIQLRSLGLGGNALGGSIPAELGNLVNLEWLDLARSDLTGLIPAELGNLVNLERLDLARNDLTGPVPAELGSLSNLEWLSLLDNNQLTGALGRTLLQLTLDALNIAGTQVCDPPDASFQQWLATIPDFTSSGLSCNAVANRPPRPTGSIPAQTLTVDGQAASGNRPPVAVSAASFTDHRIVRGVTPVKAVHFTELRTRIDALREAAGLGGFAWTNRVLTVGVTPVRLVHLLELRSALEEAYSAAGRTEPGWTDTDPTQGATPIRAVYVMELRSAVLALE